MVVNLLISSRTLSDLLGTRVRLLAVSGKLSTRRTVLVNSKALYKLKHTLPSIHFSNYRLERSLNLKANVSRNEYITRSSQVYMQVFRRIYATNTWINEQASGGRISNALLNELRLTPIDFSTSTSTTLFSSEPSPASGHISQLTISAPPTSTLLTTETKTK